MVGGGRKLGAAGSFMFYWQLNWRLTRLFTNDVMRSKRGLIKWLLPVGRVLHPWPQHKPAHRKLPSETLRWQLYKLITFINIINHLWSLIDTEESGILRGLDLFRPLTLEIIRSVGDGPQKILKDTFATLPSLPEPRTLHFLPPFSKVTHNVLTMTFYCVNCCPMSHLFHFRPLRISFRADPGLAPSYPRDLLILNQRATDPLLVVDPKPRLETLKAEVASLEGSNLSMLLPSWRHIKPRCRSRLNVRVLFLMTSSSPPGRWTLLLVKSYCGTFVKPFFLS